MKHFTWLASLCGLLLALAQGTAAQQSATTADSLLMSILPATYDRPINPDQYLIRPGETIYVTFLQSSLGGLSLQVSPDGRVIHPSLGVIDLSSTTLTQARERLLGPLRSKYNVKDVMMTVGEPRPVGISVTGAVRNPGFYRIYNSARVSDAVRLAGGILPEGSTRRITLSGGPALISADLDKALYLGDDNANPYLYAGYHLDVPIRSSEVVQVMGEVLKPREIELLPGDTPGSILELAGGLTSDADSAGAKLIGEEGASLWTVANIKAKDIIQVPRRLADSTFGITVLGAVNRPGRFPISDSLTLAAAIEQAGGFEPEANSGRVAIFRIAENDQYSRVQRERYPMTAVNEDFQATRLKPQDSVFVPRKLGWVRVGGQVKAPGIFPFVEGKDVNYYIFTAGGFLPTANTNQVGMVNRISKIRRLVSVNTRVLDGDEISALEQVVNP